MTNRLRIVGGLILVSIASCTSNEGSEGEVLNNVTAGEVAFKTVSAEDVCEIKVPEYFDEMTDINPDALIQYGYIEAPNEKSVVIEDEIYAIVLVDYKNEINETLGDSMEIDILDFNTMCVHNLSLTLDDLTVEYETPKVQEQNGVRTIHNEFYGRLGQYLVYYQFGIFETEIGYYQVLTWCMQDHLTAHKEEMFKITSSFKEL